MGARYRLGMRLYDEKKCVIAVTNQSLRYLGEDSNLHLKIINLKFKIRNVINPGYPLVGITFIDETDLEIIQNNPGKMDELYSRNQYNTMANRVCDDIPSSI